MKCHSIDRGTPRRHRVVCKCKYFALNTLSSTKTQDFNPQEVRQASPSFLYGSPPWDCAAGLLSQLGFNVLQGVEVSMTQAWQKQFRVGPAKIGPSAEGTSTLGGSGGMLPREILKVSFSKIHI